MLKFRQRALTPGLIARIRRLSSETMNAGFGGMSDVIAHSFGTWLLGHALRNDPTLKVGRIIPTGCILRPDFDWNELITRGQARLSCVTLRVTTSGRVSPITSAVLENPNVNLDLY